MTQLLCKLCPSVPDRAGKGGWDPTSSTHQVTHPRQVWVNQEKGRCLFLICPDVPCSLTAASWIRPLTPHLLQPFHMQDLSEFFQLHETDYDCNFIHEEMRLRGGEKTLWDTIQVPVISLGINQWVSQPFAMWLSFLYLEKHRLDEYNWGLLWTSHNMSTNGNFKR